LNLGLRKMDRKDGNDHSYPLRGKNKLSAPSFRSV
jgi:hypothetical protein